MRFERFLKISMFPIVRICSRLSAAVVMFALVSSAVAENPVVPNAKRPDSVMRPVILISVDGLRPDAIESFEAQTMMKLMSEGSYTLAASTILPSKTLPSHTSMLTGELPETHGILWNSEQVFSDFELQTPTVFGVLHSKGLKT